MKRICCRRPQGKNLSRRFSLHLEPTNFDPNRGPLHGIELCPSARRSILSVFLLCIVTSFGIGQSADDLICRKIFSYAFERKLGEKPIGEIIVEVGRQFLGAPYEAHTLDQSGPEHLVANLRSFDCVTFVENVLALSRCIKAGILSPDAYRKQLTALRYRKGIINGYASRLHYFTDWIRENERAGILYDVSRQLGGVAYKKSMSFMTEHRSLYAKLADDSSFMALQEREDSLRHSPGFYLPRTILEQATSTFQNGDIVGMTPADSTLDVSHTGFAVKMGNGAIHYMHAPDVRGHVRISTEPLATYVKKKKSWTGVIIARPL